jgi:LAO/AO transport system kinase
VSVSDRFLAGDERALARAITLVEAGLPEGGDLLRRLRLAGRGAAPGARVVGVTGAPGSGKSTLVDRLVEVARARGRRIGVVAVDPSSPFTGGAILGDRIRMTRWHADPGVFIRSMASRGHLGGLAASTLQVVTLLLAAGVDDVVIETVGVGQGEVEIVGVADTTVVVLTPGQGDGVQAAKAGLMEIADVFVVNKADHEGASRLVRDVRAMLELAALAPGAWLPPVVETVASDGRGTDDLARAIDAHGAHLLAGGGLVGKRRGRVRHEVTSLAAGAVTRAGRAVPDESLDDVAAGRRAPEALVRELLASLLDPDRAPGERPPRVDDDATA